MNNRQYVRCPVCYCQPVALKRGKIVKHKSNESIVRVLGEFMLRKNELVNEVNQILLEHGTLWYDVDTPKLSNEIVERVLELVQKEPTKELPYSRNLGIGRKGTDY
jgi:hypothetical protein